VTINRELAFLRNLYTMVITWGKATDNPVKKVRFARENNGRMRILTPEEEAKLLAHCGPQFRPLVITALLAYWVSGFRAALADLRRRRLPPSGDDLRAAYIKNSESRSVPMNEVLTATLQTVRMSTAADGPVFRTRTDEPYRSFCTAFIHAVHQASRADFTFHDLRHTFASWLVMSGVDLPTVQALMGHKDNSMTLRYTYLSSDHKQQAVCVPESFVEKSPRFSPQRREQGTATPRKPLKN